jgi:hypothetical protein
MNPTGTRLRKEIFLLITVELLVSVLKYRWQNKRFLLLVQTISVSKRL